MGKAKELDEVINAISKIGKEAEEVSNNFQGILKRVTNPGMPAKEVIQRLLEVRNKVTSAFKSLNQIRETAVEERIKFEGKSPPPQW